MDESRKDFEQAYEQLRKDGQTINLWDVWSMAWTASRAAIEIELPKPSSMLNRLNFNSTYHSVNAIKAEDVQQAIRAAGIKVKE